MHICICSEYVREDLKPASRAMARLRQVSPELRDWLLDCPALTSVSMLVLDAARCGLIDIEEEIARAVSHEARMQTLKYREMRIPHMRRYKHFNRYSRTLRVRIDEGVAVLDGALGEESAIRQTRSGATLETETTLPETLITALTGRPLGSLVSSPLLDGRGYLIASATNTAIGSDVTFKVPMIPIAGIRAVIPSLRPGFSARPKRGRGRCR